MQLNRAARRFYTQECTITDLQGQLIPDSGPWEASFDGGLTWVIGEQDEDTGWWQWLVAGPLVDNTADPLFGATLSATITDWTTQPKVRLVDNPEIEAEDAPPIELVG